MAVMSKEFSESSSGGLEKIGVSYINHMVDLVELYNLLRVYIQIL